MNQSNPAPAVGQDTPKPLGRAPHALSFARKKLQPGQAGTRKVVAAYGDKLVCVRYRYDAANKRRIKTVELVIEETPWQPRPAKIPSNQIMHLRIKYGEVALGKQVKAAGGKWNRDKQAWELPYQEVLKLGLSERIVQELLGHDDVETTQIYTHALAKRLQNVRSPADMFGKNGLMKANLSLSDLPPALEKRFRETVANQYKGDVHVALAAFLDLHDKHGAALKTS